MSDRSGVGAPTHDGAEPGSSGSGDPADDASSSSAAGGPSRRERAPRPDPDAPRAKRRFGADLLGAVLGGDTSAAPAGAPPGVPTSSERDVAADATEVEPDVEPAPRPARRASPTRSATRDPADTPAAREGGLDDTSAEPAVDATSTAMPRPEHAVAPLVATELATDAGREPEGRGRPMRRSGPLRARQVHRIIRRIDPWSVLKLSLIFYFCVWLMVVISGVLIWGLAVGSGTVESLEDFIAKLLAFEEFEFNADQIFRLFAMGGLIMVFLGTAVSAILAVLFNLISDLIGGVRVTVIEEETTRRIVRRS